MLKMFLLRKHHVRVSHLSSLRPCAKLHIPSARMHLVAVSFADKRGVLEVHRLTSTKSQKTVPTTCAASAACAGARRWFPQRSGTRCWCCCCMFARACDCVPVGWCVWSALIVKCRFESRFLKEKKTCSFRWTYECLTSSIMRRRGRRASAISHWSDRKECFKDHAATDRQPIDLHKVSEAHIALQDKRRINGVYRKMLKQRKRRLPQPSVCSLGLWFWTFCLHAFWWSE